MWPTRSCDFLCSLWRWKGCMSVVLSDDLSGVGNLPRRGADEDLGWRLGGIALRAAAGAEIGDARRAIGRVLAALAGHGLELVAARLAGVVMVDMGHHFSPGLGFAAAMAR